MPQSQDWLLQRPQGFSPSDLTLRRPVYNQPMRATLVLLVTAAAIWAACNLDEQRASAPEPDADQLDTISNRIAALETAVSDPTSVPTPAPISTATRTPRPTVAPAPIVTPTAAPAPIAVLPTSIPAGRQDICYRALPVQQSLLNKFPGPDLCAAITVGELFRLQELEVRAEGHLLKRDDFADMPNLKRLEVSTDLYGLSPDVFHALSGLKDLELLFRLDANQSLQIGQLSGVPPGLETFTLIIRTYSGDDEQPRLVALPADMFAPVSRIEHLRIYLDSGRGHCLRFDPRTLSGLSYVESLSVGGGNGIWPMPKDLFADLESLEALELDGPSCRRDGDRFERDYDEGGRHRLYFPVLETLLKMADYCGDTNYCEAVGLIDR